MPDQGPDVRVKRIYDAPAAGDGRRVLVDRVWPRGVSKERAALDLWCKDVAPSAELRKWFGHDPEKFDEFRARYLKELEQPDAVAALADLRGTEGVLTLLTASQAVAISQAAVLADVLGG
ncbi:MAG TPA: DUF488 family protein [Jatrophihabitantaceae bacterium]|jgi:uncharacterized protein YeaO (DUF488 family)|nr:DUF488 family protein [Jatrophihabitantaceae bacterium]